MPLAPFVYGVAIKAAGQGKVHDSFVVDVVSGSESGARAHALRHVRETYESAGYGKAPVLRAEIISKVDLYLSRSRAFEGQIRHVVSSFAGQLH